MLLAPVDHKFGPIAQWLEHRAYTSAVPGSSPGGSTKLMYFIPPLLLFLGVIFGIMGRQHHNHEFIGLSYIFFLAAFGATTVLFFALSAL